MKAFDLLQVLNQSYNNIINDLQKYVDESNSINSLEEAKSLKLEEVQRK